MAITTQTNVFKVDLYNGAHNFKASGGFAYRMLLVKGSPTGAYDKTLANVGTPGVGSPSTTNVGTDEVSGAGYASGGLLLSDISATLYGDTAVVTFATNPAWAGATFSTSCAVIYTTDATAGTPGRTVAIFDFGGVQSVVNGAFTVNLPAAGAATGLIRSL